MNADADDANRRWRTPTGEPCPRALTVDGRLDGPADCHGCGCCLLLAGLVDPPWPEPRPGG
jgi:hypothetical protein